MNEAIPADVMQRAKDAVGAIRDEATFGEYAIHDRVAADIIARALMAEGALARMDALNHRMTPELEERLCRSQPAPSQTVLSAALAKAARNIAARPPELRGSFPLPSLAAIRKA